jgi:hypothetical protein
MGAESYVLPEDVEDTFYKYKCNRTDCAKALGIARSYFYKLLDENKEFKEKFFRVEKSLGHEWVDVAEKNMWYLLSNPEKRPGHALKAAMYILDKRGKDRGWEGTSSQSDDVQKLDNVLSFWSQMQAAQRERKMEEMSMSAESKS